MKTINSQNQRICLFLSLIVAVIFTITITAQTKSDKNDNSESQPSLEGLTEAILIDGQPALRILSAKSGSVEIRFDKRDGEDSLVFAETRLNSFGFGVKPADEGKLYVTKSKISYVPYTDKENFFNASTSEIQGLELKKVGQGFEVVMFELQDDKKRFIFNGTVFLSGSVWGGLRFKKKDLRPSLEFLLKALKDFDSALAEFNKLTASVCEPDEEEEEFEEDEDIETNEKYDRFKDRTFISTSKMRIKGKKRSLRTCAEYDFAGKTQTKPENITLYFYGSATSPIFREDNLELNFLVDSRRVPLGNVGIVDEEKKKTIIRQTVSVSIPYDTFNQISNGKKVEFQIGELEYMLTDEHLEAFRKFLSYEIEE